MLRRSFTAGLAGLWLPSIARAEPRMARDPFGLGIASGCPTPESVVLWTRLVAEDGFGERLAGPVVVDWAIAEDDAMRKVVRTGKATAEARWAHSIHVLANGLRPARPYWYRFAVRGAESPIGRTKTAPAAADLYAALKSKAAVCCARALPVIPQTRTSEMPQTAGTRVLRHPIRGTVVPFRPDSAHPSARTPRWKVSHQKYHRAIG